MVNHKTDLREIVDMILCALLSLVTFPILLVYSGQLPVVLGLVVSLACPVVWLAFLLWNNGDDGGGLVQRVKRRAALRRPTRRWDGQPAGVPVES